MPPGRNIVNVTPVCWPASVILRSSVGSWRSVGSSSDAISQRWWSCEYSASKRGRSATDARARGGHRAAELELGDVLVPRLAAFGDRELDVREQRRALDPRHEVGDDEVGISDPLQLQLSTRILRDPGEPEVVGHAPSQLVHEPYALGATLFELGDDAHAQVELGALLRELVHARDLRRERPRLGVDLLDRLLERGLADRKSTRL